MNRKSTMVVHGEDIITDKKKYKPLVSVVVPGYNESSIVRENLSELCRYMESLETDYSWELIFVNDGSTDDTGRIAETFAKERDNVRVIHHNYNMRLGQALRTAFSNCRGDYVVTMDLDLSYSPDHIEMLLAKIRETGADIVMASPYAKGGNVSNVPWYRKVLSKWANGFLSFISKENISTLTCMVRVYDGKFLSSLNLKAMHVDIHPEILYKASILRAQILEIPAHLQWRSSKQTAKQRKSSMKIMKGTVWTLLLGFMFRPFMFFLLPGFILFILSLYPITWVFIHTVIKYQTLSPLVGTFGNRVSGAISMAFKESPHAFIVGGFALMIAIQLISLGIISLQNHRYFKELFYLGSNLYKCTLKNNH